MRVCRGVQGTVCEGRCAEGAGGGGTVRTNLYG